MKNPHRLSRRTFLGSVAAAATVSIVPSHVLGGKDKTPPSEQFRFAQVGCGGRGAGDMGGVLGAGGKLVGMCDVDPVRASKAFKNHADVPKFSDYRKMLDKLEKDIDGVVVGTPDHTHAVVALDAMKRGKHVYVEKPLARTFQECQVLLDAARKHKVVTQMGNQGHSGNGLKLWEKMIEADAFGEVEHIHTWSNRPIWPQGMTEAPKSDPVPEGFDWDSWIGPVAMRPFSKKYLPFNWRGWWDFGCGAMGDMACHNMDPALWIYKLGLPTKVKAQVSAPAGIAYPAWSIIEYTFAGTSVHAKPIKLTWYDGKKLPPKPAGSHPQLKVGTNGCMVVGSKMTALGGSHAKAPVAIALGDKEYGSEVKDAERHWREELKKLKGGNHHGEWVQAARANDPTQTGSKFEYAAPMTQAILLGCAALRFPGKELEWDNDKRQFTNLPEANKWLSFQPRDGYSLSL